MSKVAPVGLILNYRGAGRTAACVANLLGQGIRPVLVWDNSEDGGCSAAELHELLQGESDVNVVRSECNLGFAAGANRGLAWLSKHHPRRPVLLINNDAILLSGAAEKLMKMLSHTPEALVVYPAINHGGEIFGTVYYQRYLGLITRRCIPGSFPYPSGCCLLINLAKLRMPLFDERYFMYGEDILLGYRLRHVPKAMLHVPQVLVTHEGSASSGKTTLFYETRMVAAHFLLARDLADGRIEAWLLIAARMPVLLARSLVRSARAFSSVPLIALWKGFTLAQSLVRRSSAAP